MSAISLRTSLGLLLAITGGFLNPLHACAEENVKVTVLTILASDQNNTVDPKLECLAKEVRKQDPKLTGFRIANSACKSMAVGTSFKFPLVEEQVAQVVIEHSADQDDRISLKLKAPGVGEIVYNSACGKFFPIVTSYRTKDKERVIITVMVKPCKH